MKTVISHIEYEIASLTNSIARCEQENRDWASLFSDNFGQIDQVVIDQYKLELAEFKEALAILTTI